MRLLASLVLFSITAPPVFAANPAAWPQRMLEMEKTITDLLPELVARTPNKKKLTAGANTLVKLSHAMEKEGKKIAAPADADPSLELYAEMLHDNAEEAQKALKRGDVEGGRRMLQSVTSACVGCHTRHGDGPAFGAKEDSPAAKKLPALSRAELHLATRQFDRGAEELAKLVEDKSFEKKNTFDWEHALRLGLRVSVQVLDNRKLAQRFVTAARKASTQPQYLQEATTAWQKSLDAWAAEPEKKPTSADEVLAEARRLEAAGRLLQRYPADRSGDIQYLRMASAYHSFLRVAPQDARVPEALFALGHAQEVSGSPEFWSMPQSYFELCVRKGAHTEQALLCFERYEALVYFGWSGSSGVRIPDDVAERVKKLRALAEPKKEGPKS